MTDPTFDAWRDNVSQALGRIEANVLTLTVTRKVDDERITKLEDKQSRRDGVVAVLVLIIPLVPFLPDFIKKVFG